MKNFYIGHLKKDRAEQKEKFGNEWLIGNFDKFNEDVRKIKDLEVKYWYLRPDDTHKNKKQKNSVEFTLVISGHTKGFVDNEVIELVSGEYILIKPGVESNTAHEILEETWGLTIKAPSDPKDKVVVE